MTAGCLALLVLTADRGVAQVIQADTTGTGWTVASIAHADLWFHGLAILGLNGDGPLPLYNPEYAAAIRAEKERRGVYPTTLDEKAEELARDLDREDTWDIIHFVPLYFPTAGFDELFAGLSDVTRDRWGRRLASADMEAGGALMKHVFATRGARHAVAEFLDALRQEWDVFFRDYWHESVSGRLPQIQEIQAVWDQYFAPRLYPFLRSRNLGEGFLIVTPALGFEGRIVMDRSIPTTVAVPLPDPPQPAGAAPFLFVKELCFVAVPDVQNSIDHRDEVEAERKRRNLAVRCGEALLQRYMPDATEAYREIFALPFKGDEAAPPNFEALYPVDEDILRQMRAELSGPENR